MRRAPCAAHHATSMQHSPGGMGPVARTDAQVPAAAQWYCFDALLQLLITPRLQLLRPFVISRRCAAFPRVALRLHVLDGVAPCCSASSYVAFSVMHCVHTSVVSWLRASLCPTSELSSKPAWLPRSCSGYGAALGRVRYWARRVGRDRPASASARGAGPGARAPAGSGSRVGEADGTGRRHRPTAQADGTGRRRGRTTVQGHCQWQQPSVGETVGSRAPRSDTTHTRCEAAASWCCNLNVACGKLGP
jgi:hypothetical protein